MANKMTYVNVLDICINDEVETGKHGAEFLAKLQALKTQLENKNKGGEKKMTATQKENASLKEKILEAMDVGKAYSVNDLEKIIGESQNKTISLASQLVTANKLTKEKLKGKVYYSLVVEESLDSVEGD